MKLLMLLGTVLTVIVWTQLGVIPGIVCGILFMGGIGWLPIIAVFNVVAIPGSREFIAAWEARHGPMVRHRPDTFPPPGAYRQWRRERRRTRESAGDWIDRQFMPPSSGHHSATLNVRAVMDGDGRGITFTIGGPGHDHPITWRFDDGFPEDMFNQMRFQTAEAQLCAALGLPALRPGAAGRDPLGELTWDPPLTDVADWWRANYPGPAAP